MSVSKNILESPKEGVEIISQLGVTVMVEVCACHVRRCALFLCVPVNGIAFNLSKMLVVNPGAAKNAVVLYSNVLYSK